MEHKKVVKLVLGNLKDVASDVLEAFVGRFLQYLSSLLITDFVQVEQHPEIIHFYGYYTLLIDDAGCFLLPITVSVVASVLAA